MPCQGTVPGPGGRAEQGAGTVAWAVGCETHNSQAWLSFLHLPEY